MNVVRYVGSLLILGCFAVLGVACGSQPPVQADLHGTVVGGKLQFPPTTVHTPRTLTFALFNPGNAPILVKDLEIQGEEADTFQMAPKPDLPITLKPGKSFGVNLSVEFLAKRVGEASAELKIHFANVSGPESVSSTKIVLAGSALQTNSPGVLRLEVREREGSTKEKSIDFGELTTKEALSKELFLYNESDKPITIAQLNIEGAGKSAFRFPFSLPTPFVIQPGKENGKVVFVQASSGAPGHYEANLVVVSPDATNVKKTGSTFLGMKVDVVKYMRNGYISYNNHQLLFLDVPKGQSKEKTIELRNSGEIEVRISSLKFQGENPTSFQTKTKMDFPWVIKPKARRSITFRYTTKAGVGESAVALFTYTGDRRHKMPRSSQVYLIHQKSQPRLSWSCSSQIYFHNATLQRGQGRECRARNVGNAPLVISSFAFKKERGSDNAFEVEELPVTIQPNQSRFIRFMYKPKAYTNMDTGIITLKTNLSEALQGSVPKILVGGHVAARMVQLEVNARRCGTDAECTNLDSRMRCLTAIGSFNKFCQASDPRKPFLTFPHTKKGEVIKKSFTIYLYGQGYTTVKSVAFKGDAGPFKITSESLNGRRFWAGTRLNVTLSYTGTGDASALFREVVVKTDAQNQPEASIRIETTKAP